MIHRGVRPARATRPAWIAAAVVWIVGCGGAEPAGTGDQPPAPTPAPELSAGGNSAPDAAPQAAERALPPGLECLRRAYAANIEHVAETPAGHDWTVTLTDGTLLPWDDGAAGKTFTERLDAPDLEDMFSIPYPVGGRYAVPGTDDDPGRIRVEPLFAAVYGADAAAVRKNLVDVDWLPGRGGGTVRFNARNGAAAALRAVGAGLAALPGELVEYVVPSGGTFNWRPIAGTNRRSVHSFGIAIDVNVVHSDYWRWGLRDGVVPPYRNRIPFEVVEVFEQHGFVWGGKWYHYDTMHFEYRPELLDPRCVRRVADAPASRP